VIKEIVRLSIDGEPRDDLVPDLVSLDVSEDVDQADVFALRLSVVAGARGAWRHIDDEELRPWRRITVEAGYPGAVETLVDGFATHSEVMLAGDREPYLELSGMDATAAMDLEEKQAAWPDKADHEIAREIFQGYGLDPDVEDTKVTHRVAVSTILQTESDIRFLRRLAARNAFECTVRAGTGVFRAPNLTDPPQKALVLAAGGEANLADLTLRVDGTPAGVAEIRRVDPIEKREDSRQLASTPRRRMGATDLPALRGRLPAGRTLLRRQVSASTAEMESRLRAAYEGADRFVTASGEVDSRAYRAVLRAGRLVTVRGAGRTYNGLYYVTRVHHSFRVEGYTQRFTAYRNGIGPGGGL
jgi:phage protein D